MLITKMICSGNSWKNKKNQRGSSNKHSPTSSECQLVCDSFVKKEKSILYGSDIVQHVEIV